MERKFRDFLNNKPTASESLSLISLILYSRQKKSSYWNKLVFVSIRLPVFLAFQEMCASALLTCLACASSPWNLINYPHLFMREFCVNSSLCLSPTSLPLLPFHGHCSDKTSSIQAEEIAIVSSFSHLLFCSPFDDLFLKWFSKSFIWFVFLHPDFLQIKQKQSTILLII